MAKKFEWLINYSDTDLHSTFTVPTLVSAAFDETRPDSQ